MYMQTVTVSTSVFIFSNFKLSVTQNSQVLRNTNYLHISYEASVYKSHSTLRVLHEVFTSSFCLLNDPMLGTNIKLRQQMQ